jgi:demethylmenaquinone methyltransferase/2-methoxy-6-polyprenyl-1,4-benzoquinol methylase
MTDPEVPTPASDRDPTDARTAPHAAREMANMFDQVSRRYDLLNRIMSLGRDAAWRRAMWSEVPESARTVLDLCTGSGTSLTGLRRPGRLVIGIDASLRMLEHAAYHSPSTGWAPRLVCGDAFRLPLRDGLLDGVTVAFGIRNLRPRLEALVEIRRGLGPGGILVVLEAAAPGNGPLGWLHGLYLRRLIPVMGRLSPDPSAYRYLSESILEFGAGPEFEADLARAGFELLRRRSFLFGATRLWTARRRSDVATSDPAGTPVHPARLRKLERGEMPNGDEPGATEWRIWNRVQLVLSIVLAGALVYALWVFLSTGLGRSLEPWQRSGMLALLILGALGFTLRAIVLALADSGPPPRR